MAEIPEIGDLRPLSTGELIDRGFTLYRQYFAGLFMLALLSQMAPLATGLVMMRGTNLAPGPAGFAGQPMMDLPHLALMCGVWFLGQMVSFLFAVWITAYLGDAYLTGSPTMKASFRRLREVFGKSLVTALLNILFIGLSMLFPILAITAVVVYAQFHPPQELMAVIIFVLVAGLLIVGSLAPVLIVFVRLMLTAPAVALEKLAGWRAAKRSSSLVRFDPGLGFWYWGEMRLSLLLLPLVAIEVLSTTLTSLPVTTYTFFRHGPIGQMAAPPESAQVLTQILMVLSGSLLLPLYLIAVTLFYFDVRVRREGFDLERMAERLKSAGSPGANMRKLAILCATALLALPLPAAAQTDDQPPQGPQPQSSGPVTDPAQVMEHYHAVLARPAFEETREPDTESKMRDWLARWFERLGSGFNELENAPEMPQFASLLMTVFVLLSLSGLAYLLVRLVRRRGAWKEDATPEAQEKTRLREPEFYEAELAEATATGDWRRAWLACWRQFLSRLERGELVAPDRSRTNREYLAELRQRGPLPGEADPLLAKLVDAYDRFIYGRSEIAEPEWDSFRQQVDEASLLLGVRDRTAIPTAKGAA